MDDLARMVELFFNLVLGAIDSSLAEIDGVSQE